MLSQTLKVQKNEGPFLFLDQGMIYDLTKNGAAIVKKMQDLFDLFLLLANHVQTQPWTKEQPSPQ